MNLGLSVAGDAAVAVNVAVAVSVGNGRGCESEHGRESKKQNPGMAP